MARAVTLIHGAGPAGELAEVVRDVVERAGASLSWNRFPAPDAPARPEDPLVAAVRATGVCLDASLPLPGVQPGVPPAAERLAPALGLDVCAHPARSYPGVVGARPDVDLVLFRGTTEGPFAGLGLRTREPAAVRLAAELGIAGEPGLTVLPTTRAAAVRVVEAACEFARARGTSRFSVCHRAALLPHTDGLFLHTARNVVVRYPEVGFEARDVDEVARELVRAPQDFAVLAAQPGAGSLLAAVAAGLVGGPDFAPCFHLGPAGPQATPQATTGLAVFGATWPTVPPAAGAGLGALPGPWAVILASVWALRHLGETAPAGRLEAAAAAVLADRGAGGDGAAWTAAAVGEALTDALTHAS